VIGRVADDHVLLEVGFLLPDGRAVIHEMVVDTGYVGTLTLPAATIQSFSLTYLRRSSAKLADGSTVVRGVFLATIMWHGRQQRTEVMSRDDRPLLGMLLLDGSRMMVDFTHGGAMELTESP